MAIKLMSVNGVNNENIAEFIVDTEDEKSQIPAEYMIQGTEAQVIEGGKRYRLDCNLDWTEVKESTGGGSGGGDTRPTISVLPLSITQNGNIVAPRGKAYNPIRVNVPNTYEVNDEGKVLISGTLTPQTAHSTITQNGSYDTTLNNSVVVDIDFIEVNKKTIEKDVNFIDYDGQILYSYTTQEFLNLTELPENPIHIGLTSQGWNWTLSDAKAYVAIYNKLWIGQMYITSDGKTRIYIHLDDGRLSPYLTFGLYGNAIVDWGDNSSTDTVIGYDTATPKTLQHTYAKEGDYVISIGFTGSLNNQIALIGDRNYGSKLLWGNITSDIPNRIYQNAIQKIELGNKVYIELDAFAHCGNLTSITIPNNLYRIRDYSFSYCNNLVSITIPNNMTAIGDYIFYDCYSLKNISLPRELTNVGYGTFYYCYGLTNVTIPDNVTDIKGYLFMGDNELKSIILPNSVTNFGMGSFSACCSLSNITIGNNVTDIGASAFSSCQGLGKIRFLSNTPPIVAQSNVFYKLSYDCIIYIPKGTFGAYTTATNYPDPGIYSYVEEV